MLDRLLRPLKERVLAPFARLLTGVSPNFVTVCGFFFGVVCCVLLVLDFHAWAFLFWVLNRLGDGLDGVLARLQSRQSGFGGYLDILLDFAIYAGIPICLVGFSGGPWLHLALSLMLALFYLNTASWMYLAALLEKQNQGAKARGEYTSVAMPEALVGGVETMVFYSFFLLFPDYLTVLFLLFTALVAISVVQRFLWASRNRGLFEDEGASSLGAN